MIRFHRAASVAVAAGLLAALTGCGAATPGSDLTMRNLGASKASKAATAKAGPKAATKAAVSTGGGAIAGDDAVLPAAVVVPVAAAARQAEVATAGAGTVRVAFASLGATRSLMSLDDVAGVRVSLAAANGATQVQGLDRAALAGDAPGVAFAGVAAGPATLTVEALDAAGGVLGTSSAATDVVARQTATVDLTVRLAATGNVAANVAIVEDDAVVVAATPTPAPTAAPTAAPSALPSFLASTAPTATPTPSVAPSALPSFLTSTGTTREVWGRLYDYAGTQVTTGSVRFLSTDAARPFDVSADLRADGYYYVAGVPTGATIQVSATSGTRGVTSWYLFSDDAATTYDWLDLFVAETATTGTDTTNDGWSWWW